MTESDTRPFRSIIKDGQTYDEDYRSTDVEISAWIIKRAAVDIDATASGSLMLKVDGELQYDTILEVVLGRRRVEGDEGTFTEADLPQPIDMAALRGAYKMARRIAADSGLSFVTNESFSEAIEDNKLISEGEIRPVDRPTGDFKASVHVIKNSPSGTELETYEYEVDFDGEKLISNDGYGPPV